MKFPSVTVGDLTFRLLLLPPNWSTPPVVTHRLDTLVGEGRTTIEERRPERATLLLTQKIFLSPTGYAADDWRKGLAALANHYVAMPLWVDALPVASWESRIYDAQKLLNFDPATGDFAIFDGPDVPEILVGDEFLPPPYPLLAPLLLGRWSARPPLQVNEAAGGDLTVELTEARPYAWRIGVHSYGTGWTATPNRIGPLRDASDFGLEQIALPGAGAEPALDRTDTAARWHQEGDFDFPSRLAVRTALTVFADKRGSWASWSPVPAWLQPGAATSATPDTYTARFAADVLTFTYLAPDYATARVGFIQEIDTGVRSQALAGEAYLYRLRYALDPDHPELFTNWDAPLTGAEGTYQPVQIAHTEILRSLKPQDEKAEIQLAHSASTLAADWLRARLFGLVRLTIWKCDPADVAGTQGAPLFEGVVQLIRPDGNVLSLTATLFGGLLSRRAPGWVFGPKCNVSVFSDLCGLAEADYDSAGTAAAADLSADGHTLTVHGVTGWGDHGDPDTGFYRANWFAFGTLRTGAGRARQIASILTSARAGGDLVVTLNRPLWADLITGTQAVALIPGCGGQYPSDCGTKFDNQDNFRGFPFIPEFIETRAAGTPRAPKK